MRTSELARLAGIGTETLRFYEREKLIPMPHRTRSGYRDYSKQDLERVRFIRSCQEIGFTLKDVKEVFEFHRILAHPDQADAIKPKAQEKMLKAAENRLASIDGKLRILKQMKKDMSGLVATLAGRQKPVCPVSGRQVS